ncbi:helix-turn-helix transcriptional regulator [Paucibacter sp. AS339]|uniref:helix-turn-helix domain-containing protein n=1 Tax=Paucibacter hankyongi TaxID=3133434 RepID=UPI00309F1ACF
MNWKFRAAEAAFVAELAQLRLQMGLSRHALAEQVGIEPSDVDLSEAGLRRVDVVELFQWCKACGSSLDVFVERIGQRLLAKTSDHH